MVYCGKPSKGCSNCRERKIRCDQKEPGCGQCDKRQQKCPGYRNLVDLMFRDESSHVIKKAKARARKKAKLGISPPGTPSDTESRFSATPEPRSRTLSLIVPQTPAAGIPASRNHDDSSMLMSPESGSWPVTPPMAQLYTLPPACQEDGFAYFFSRYVTADETVSHQKFDFLRDVWRPSPSSPDTHIDGVLASMTAVGLMGLASTAQSPSLMDAARKSYGTALRLTNHALQDPAEAVKDSTMLSVLILGVFEMMTESTPRTMTVEAFQEHVNGAAALARMRGPAQFQTRAGRRMFSMLCQRVVVSCVQRNVPMPDCLIELWHEMSKTTEPGNPDQRLMPLMWQVLQLRSDIKSGFLSDPEIIVDRLISIDQDIENQTSQFTPSWKYRIFQFFPNPRLLPVPRGAPQSPQKAEIPSQRSHRPTSPQQLGLMNPADGTIGSGDDDDDAAPIATVEIRETPSPPTSPSARSSDSASSVYSPLSATGGPRPYPSGLTVLDVTEGRDAEDKAERYMLLISATSSVVWPLFVVGMSTACTPEMRAYVVGRLRTLYMETGIRQADAVANLLEEHELAVGTEVGAGVGIIGPGMGPGPVPGAGWLDMELREPGQQGVAGPGLVGEEYGLGLMPLTSPGVMKPEFDMVWG
ncbi:hypothetical protein CHGG_05609 [Chaetomium globosum CBS 148.51]|uniref:Zn(2)-C6 fungal-type domain-containing protein n=1 Tax=Chaetomium globosum (strain ATCC 6205 / CBS 148.51 / DSM 1962 / NBRC 6347 / NRRL 1970) TaxID=306901 RepID=Q2H6V6_CHAGB|nr:uncharacterized protein CHGG_05609 [Chaetomium globosum CBS 148.51]EAQ88990.1 hypothetical protein CHGG_05609 [Chaetomium globosum CBS 148.51]